MYTKMENDFLKIIGERLVCMTEEGVLQEFMYHINEIYPMPYFLKHTYITISDLWMKNDYDSFSNEFLSFLDENYVEIADFYYNKEEIIEFINNLLEKAQNNDF